MNHVQDASFLVEIPSDVLALPLDTSHMPNDLCLNRSCRRDLRAHAICMYSYRSWWRSPCGRSCRRWLPWRSPSLSVPCVCWMNLHSCGEVAISYAGRLSRSCSNDAWILPFTIHNTFNATHHEAIIDFLRISRSYDGVIPSSMFTFPAGDCVAMWVVCLDQRITECVGAHSGAEKVIWDCVCFYVHCVCSRSESPSVSVV